MTGVSVAFASDAVSSAARAELQWAWSALSASTRCQSLVAFWDEACVAHYGMACDGCEPSRASLEGPICKGVMQQGKANYLANLILFPGARSAASSCCVSPCTLTSVCGGSRAVAVPHDADQRFKCCWLARLCTGLPSYKQHCTCRSDRIRELLTSEYKLRDCCANRGQRRARCCM